MKKLFLTITTLFLGLFTIASCDIKPKVNPDKVKESETTQGNEKKEDNTDKKKEDNTDKKKEDNTEDKVEDKDKEKEKENTVDKEKENKEPSTEDKTTNEKEPTTGDNENTTNEVGETTQPAGTEAQPSTENGQEQPDSQDQGSQPSETTQPSTDNGEEQPSTEEEVLPGKQNSIPYSQFIGKGENGEDLAFTDFPQLTYLIRYEDALNAHFQKKYEDVIKNKNSEKRFLSKELYEFIKKEKLFIYSFLIFTRENSEGVYTYTREKQRALIYAYMYYLPQLQSGKITQEEFKEKMYKNFSVFGILFNVEGNITHIDDDVFSPNDYNEGYVEVGVLKVHYKTFLPKKLTEEEFNKQIQNFIDIFKNLKYGTKDVYFNFD